ncbi:MAG: cytochrome C biogenesis protein [Chloroflexi bacterium]|nr:cytochrome C biogenesis protein [Chloroflexota bacterium]
MKRTPFFHTVASIARKDLQVELRSRELISSMGLFALLSILVFSFALELNRIARIEAVSGVLWVTIVFASLLGLNRSMAMERENGGLDALLIAPVNRAAIFFGKMAGNLVFMLTVAVVLLPVINVLYDISLFRPWLLFTLLLGIVGFATVGTLLATITVQTRARESLLPILMLPVALPLLLGALRASASVLNDAPLEQWVAWPQIMLVLDVIFIILGFLLFEFVIED